VQANVPAILNNRLHLFIFNHRKTLQHLNIDDLRLTLPVCSCSSSPFNYNPIGHVITGNLAILTNDKLRNTLRKGPEYREPHHINWNQNFKLLMDSIEDYARKWGKQEEVELDILSDWVTSIRSLIRKKEYFS